MFLRAIDVAVVLREAADPHQAVQCPRPFVAINGAEFEQSERQFAIAALTAVKDQTVHRAVHRFRVVRPVVHLHRRVHAVGVEVEVTGCLEQVRVGEMWRVDELVAPVLVTLAAVILHQLADGCTLRVPHREAATELAREAEQILLHSELAVVALQGLFELVEVPCERLLAFPGRAVDTLELWALLIATPVRARDALQLEECKLARARHVRADTHVDEFVSVAVGADDPIAGHFACIFCICVCRLDTLDDLDFVRLICKQFLCFGHRVFRTCEWLVLLDDLLHLFLDDAQVVIGEGLAVRQVEVVVEAVLDGRANRELGAGIQLRHRLGQYVCRRVTQHVPSGVGVVGDQRHNVAVDERDGQVGLDAVDACSDSCLAQTRPDGCCEVERCRPSRQLSA